MGTKVDRGYGYSNIRTPDMDNKKNSWQKQALQGSWDETTKFDSVCHLNREKENEGTLKRSLCRLDEESLPLYCGTISTPDARWLLRERQVE